MILGKRFFQSTKVAIFFEPIFSKDVTEEEQDVPLEESDSSGKVLAACLTQYYSPYSSSKNRRDNATLAEIPGFRAIKPAPKYRIFVAAVCLLPSPGSWIARAMTLNAGGGEGG